MHGYRLSRKQSEYILNADARYNLKIGAVRSGKSFVDVVHMIPQRLLSVADDPGLNLFLGVSKETIERNVLQPMREQYTDELVGTINNRNIAYVCGVPVYCLGAEKITQVAKIQGMSVKYCYGDEIAKWNPEVFYMLQSRLDKPYSRFDGSCNPEYPGHWLKQFIDREDIDLYLQHYTIFDNPFLPPEFVENLCKEYAGTVYYGRYIQGEWTLAEGMIYPMYQEAIAEPPEGNPEERCISIDYGTMNAFAAILWEHHGKTWYAVREYYYSGRDTGTQKTDEEYAVDLDRWLSDIKGRLKVYIDPSAASFIAQLRRRVDDNGVKKYAVIPADNDVLDGIRDTATCMRRGTIKISEDCKNLISELQGYVWEEGEGGDRPVKIADHACDAMRYFTRTRRLATLRRQWQDGSLI
jgi:PBSX family phage terminase large subunit